jgi:predicted nuclease of predicted toxin-antitoxin system
MKIVVDENIPSLTVAYLRQQGHDVLDIRGTAEQGMADQSLWQKAFNEKRLLITTDKGFAEHRNEAHHGILIIRLNQPTRLKIHQRVLQALKRYPASQWPGLLVVMRDAFQSHWMSHHNPAGK